MHLERLGQITFPPPADRIVNMMPIVAGDLDSVPESLRDYAPLLAACSARAGDVVYLTVHESWVARGRTQRRPGPHTDGTSGGPWGGGWGGSDRAAGRGIWLASTDGDCKLWDARVPATEVDAHGAFERAPDARCVLALPNYLYWITDRTPHQSVSACEDHYRQFFRLVGPEIGAWWARHSTPNPLGVRAAAPIELGDKFARPI